MKKIVLKNHVKEKTMLLLLILFFLTSGIGYAYLNSSLRTEGKVVVIPNRDVLITAANTTTSSNEASNPDVIEYLSDRVYLKPNLPGNSSLTYEVTLTNTSEFQYRIEEITIGDGINENIVVEINNSYNPIINGNSSVTIEIVVSNNTNNTLTDEIEITIPTLKLHFISYNYDGGTITGNNLQEFTSANDDILLINPTKSGYIFAGWTGTSLEERTMNVTIDTDLDQDYELVANWKMQISNNNTWWGGNHIGSYLSLPITRNNCSLNDFLITVTSGKIAVYINISGRPQNVEVPLWIPSDSPTFYSATAVTSTIDQRTFNYRLLSNYTANTQQYNTHFYITCNNSQTFYTEINRFIINHHQIYYNGNGGTTTITSTVYNPGFTVDLSPSIASRTGYTFLGWSEEIDGDVYASYKMQGGKIDASDQILYAQWVKDSN